MPHPWQPARLRRANREQEDRTHHGRSQAFTAPATSHPPIESIRRTQTEPPHPGQLRTIEPGSGRSGSWSEGIFGREPADVDEAAAAATWTAPRFGGDGGALVGDFEKA